MKKNAENNNGMFAIPYRNIRYILIGLGIMVLGYICMLGGGSGDPSVFNPAMFSPVRIVLAPVLIVLGMIFEIFAIMYKGREEGRKEKEA